MSDVGNRVRQSAASTPPPPPLPLSERRETGRVRAFALADRGPDGRVSGSRVDRREGSRCSESWLRCIVITMTIRARESGLRPDADVRDTRRHTHTHKTGSNSRALSAPVWGLLFFFLFLSTGIFAHAFFPFAGISCRRDGS